MATTETRSNIRPTGAGTQPPGSSDNDDDDDDDDDDAGVRPDAMTMLLVVAGMVAVGWNLL